MAKPADMTDRARLPMTVVGGFLGAGKTTLLQRLLSSSGRRRLAVLVNDFGALNIDVALIDQQDGRAIALTNGCVCCQIGDDLSAALIAVLESPRPFDGVVIEASGVSDPWRIAQIGLADPGLALEAVIVVVDAQAALGQSGDPLLADTMARQLAHADLVVINKIDLVDDAQRAQVREWVSGCVGSRPVLETTQADVPLPLLTGLDLRATRVGEHTNACAPGCDEAHHHGHHELHADHGAMFDTWRQVPAGPLSASALRELLRAMPAGVLRLKGLVRTDEHTAAELQFAGRHGSLRPHGRPLDVEGVVAIGFKGRLSHAELDAAFARAALAVKTPIAGAAH